jgi:hypothetical protein
MNGNESFQRLVNNFDSMDNPLEAQTAVLKDVGRTARLTGLEPYQIASALAEGYDAWSAAGIYFKVQSVALRFAGPLGATVIFLMGVGMLISILANTASKMYTWLSSNVSALASVFEHPLDSAIGLFGRLFATASSGSAKTASDAVRDQASGNALAMALTTIIPGPLGSIPSAIASALGGTVSNMAPPSGLVSTSVTSGATSLTAATSVNPSATAAGSPSTVAAATKAATTTAASGTNSLSSDLTAAGSLGSSLTSLIGGLVGSTSTSPTAASSTATTAANAASDASTAADNLSSTDLTSLDTSIDSGSTDASDLGDGSSDVSSDATSDLANAAQRLVRLLGNQGATAVISKVVKIARSRKGDFAHLRKNNSSAF